MTQTAISKALEGDSVALKAMYGQDHACSKRQADKGAVALSISSPRDLLKAASDVMISVQSGELTPLEGEKVMALLERCQKLFVSVDLVERIEALEHKVTPS